jgi:DNA-binding PadR family transcriptional regulator
MSVYNMSSYDIWLVWGWPMDIELQLPLTESTFFILLSLAPGPRHGYAILKDVQALSDGRLQLSTGTLYGAIKRLLDQDWIARIADPLPDGTERQRKVYILTDLGRRILEAETARLRSVVAKASLRLPGELL